MPDIAVIHMDLMAKGGGEAVAMNVLEALSADHDVTLLTLTEPDFEELNAYFNTNVDAPRVSKAGWIAPRLHDRYGLTYYILQNALLGRYARRKADEFDLLVSTINELGLGANSVQYIHFPFDWTTSLDVRDHIFHPTVEEDGLYERVATRIAGVTVNDLQRGTVLANSEWTAAVVEDAYSVRPKVLYPPVDTTDFDPKPFECREPGFVTIGRIERSKRLCTMIEIIDGVRDRGHDIHFHIIGPTIDAVYFAEVESMAADRPHVHLEGEIPRSELIECICTHRYGIHGKEYEHFGMAVAELAAGGTIPFVPGNGGQHVIVNDCEELVYHSPTDAIEKIDRVLSTPSLERDIRQNTTHIQQRFGRDRFKRKFRTYVDAALPRSTDRKTDGVIGVKREAISDTHRSS